MRTTKEIRMKKFCTTVVAMGVLLLAGAAANAADINVSNLKVLGAPNSGSLDVEGDLTTRGWGGSIVFVALRVGQDDVKFVSQGVGDVTKHFHVKLPTQKTVASLAGTQGTKPVKIVVFACDTYDEHQARAWIANYAADMKVIH